MLKFFFNWPKKFFKKRLRFLRFLFVGLLNTLFGYSLFSVLVWNGLHFSLSIAISTFFGVLFNFKSTGALVFKSHDNSKVLRFISVYILGYLFNVAGLYFLIIVGLSPYLGGAIMLFPLALFTYYLNSKYVFN